jgi:hypothetical protein
MRLKTSRIRGMQAGSPANSSFYTLYDKVTERTNSLFCGVQSSYNKLDPNGPAANRFARLPGGIRGLAAVEHDQDAFYAGKPTNVDKVRSFQRNSHSLSRR